MYFVSVHACMPASTQPLSSWELSRIQRPVHSTVCEHRQWGEEGVSKNSRGLQCKSQRNMFECGPAACSPISHIHSHGMWLLFFLSLQRHKPLKVTWRRLMTASSIIVESHFLYLWECFSKCFILNGSIYLVNPNLNVFLRLRRRVHSAIVVLLHFSLI